MIKFLKIRDVKSPERAFGDAGIDFYIPNYSKEYMEELQKQNKTTEIFKDRILVRPHENVLIPCGIMSNFNSNLELCAANKSSIATKLGLIVGAQVIDSSYQGEIHLHIINTTNETVELNYGQKLVQFVPRYIYDGKIEIKENDNNFYSEKSERGEKGFGSRGLF